MQTELNFLEGVARTLESTADGFPGDAQDALNSLQPSRHWQEPDDIKRARGKVLDMLQANVDAC